MAETLDWLSERIHDRKHFTARFVAHVAEVSGVQNSTVALVLCALSFLILTVTDQAPFFANAILVGVPLLLIFVYPEEKPTDEFFLLYFSAFGGVTLFDEHLESIPCYYVLKVVGFLMLFTPMNQMSSSILPKDSKVEISERSRSSNKKSSPNSAASTRTALLGLSSPNSEKTQTRAGSVASPSPVPVVPNSSHVKVTIIEEYYREEELLSPNGTVIERIVSGPFRKESVRTESSRTAKSPT